MSEPNRLRWRGLFAALLVAATAIGGAPLLRGVLVAGAPLATLFWAWQPTSAAARIIIGTGAQATSISADRASTGGAPAFTALAVQPSIEEVNPGDIGAGVLVLSAPSGFTFDTGAPSASVTVSPLAGQTTPTCDTSAIGTGIRADLTSLTSTAIMVTVTRTSSGTSKCLMTFANLRVRPTTTTAPFTGSITKSSVGFSNASVVAGVTDGVTSFGDIQTVAALWDAANSPTKSPLSLNRSQVAIGGKAIATITLKDSYGNSLTTTPTGIGSVNFGTKSTAPTSADCSTATTAGAALVVAGGAAVVTAELTFSSAGSLYVFACVTPTGGTASLFTSAAQVAVNAPPTVTSAEITRQFPDGTTSVGTTIGVNTVARTRTVTVKGTGFATGVTAAFDGNGITATAVNRVDASTLTITTAISATATAGGRSLTVTNPDGGTVSLANALTLTNPPSAAALSQTVYGAGSTSVPLILTGTNFLSATKVRFDPNNGDVTFSTVVNSSTQVTVTMTIASTARETAERRTIYVDNRDESGEVAALTQMQIAAPPAVTVSGISPSVLGQGAGSNAGACGAGAAGITVTIPGTGFSADAVTGTVQATFANTSNDVTTTVVGISSTFLSLKVCVTSAATPGARSLAVVNGDGGRVTVPSALTITGSPLLVSASEASIGQGASKRVLTFTGVGFSPTATLSLQRVVSGGGSFVQCGTPNMPLPGTLTTVTGATVAVTSRTTTTLSTQVTIDPDALTGPVWVAVDNGDGGTAPKCALTGALTITPRPTAASVSPNFLNPPTSGSTTVTVALEGANFGSGTTVAFGPASGQTVADVVASSPQVASSSRMTFVATVPSTAIGGPRNVVITNLDGGTKVITGAISVVSTGAISVSPPTIGAGASAAPLTITGTGLNPASSVAFTNAAGADVTGARITAGTITSGPSGTSLVVPVTILSSATPGLYTVTVTSPEGLATTGSFTVTVPPVVSTIGRTSASASNVAVSFGQASSGQTLYLSGSGYATTGGTPVVVAITGAGAAVSGVTISGVTVAAGGTSLTATVAVDATATVGTYALQVTNPDLGRATFASAFTVAAKPTLTGITDNNNFGAGASNRTVTLSGSGLTSSATVKFTRTGDATGSQVTIDSVVSTSLDTQLRVGISIASSATTGARSITVTNPDGGSATLVDAFAINPAPVISSITPSGLGAGRTYIVTMRGANLQSSAVAVTVGTGTNFASTLNMSIDSTVGAPTRVNSTTVTFGIRVDTGAPVGYRLITLTNLDGGVASTPFYVNTALAFSAISPQAVGIGAVAQAITITGQGFSTSGLTPKIRFLNEATLVADPLLAVDDTKTAVNADGTSVSVLVTVASSTSLGARALSIDIQDGTPLIITRSNVACIQVSTSSTPCVVFSVVGGPTVAAVSPRGRRIGAVDALYPSASPTATVVPGGSTAPVCPQPGDPSPPSTMRIAVCGTNFDAGATVSVSYPDPAAAAANGITVVATERKSTTLLWVLLKFDVTASGATTAVAGKRTITVTNGDGGTGSLLSSSSYAFEVVAPPTITGVAFTGTPTAGQTVQLGIGAKEKQFQIAGTGFVASARTTMQVTAAGSSQPSAYIGIGSVVVNSSTSMTATISVDAAAPTGAHRIILTNDDGGAPVSSALELIMIVGQPSITSVSLADVPGRTFVGRGAASVPLAIAGSGFSSQPTVSFGTGTGITVRPGLAAESGASIRGRIDVDADATPGPRDMTVTNLDGGSFTVVGAITVNPSASLTGVSPTSLGIGATGTVTLSGANLRPQATITFRLNDQPDSTITAQSVTWVSASRIDAVVAVAPNAVVGNRSIVFDNGDLSPVIVTANGIFSIHDGPQFVYMSPASITQGSTVADVVIAGTGFLPTLSVAISGTGVTVGSVTHVSQNVVNATISVADGAEVGARDVILDNGDGSSPTTAPSRFTVADRFAISNVTPSAASPGSTLPVTISGSGYAAPATVAFGDGIVVSNVVVRSASEITADLSVARGATIGARTVSVSVNGRTAGATGKFTVVDTATPVIQSVRIANVRDTTFAVSWVTDLASTGAIHWGPDDGTSPSRVAYDRRGATGTFSVHYALVSGLTPSTRYRFDVSSGATTDTNGGEHYVITTGPIIGATSPDLAVGTVSLRDGGAPESVVVHVTATDASGTSAPLTTLVTSSSQRYWATNLGNLRKASLDAPFPVTADTALTITANGGPDGIASLVTTVSAARNGSVVLVLSDEITQPLQVGWNLVALRATPAPAMTTSVVCAALNTGAPGTAVEIDRWVNGAWESHVCNLPPNDFALEPGSGYFVRVTRPVTWTYLGARVTSPATRSLGTGWNLVGASAYSATPSVASTTCTQLNTVQVGTAVELDQWIDGGWDGHRCGLPVNDFTLQAGQGYFVRLTRPATWAPVGALPVSASSTKP